MDAFKLILVSLVSWMNRQQQHVIEYLEEEVRILMEQQGSRRPKFTDEQRRRLATYRDVAIHYLTAGTHPDHDTICKFRRENLERSARASSMCWNWPAN